MARRDEYRKYLKSDAWRDQRNYSLQRTSGFCQFCGEFASQVHHVKYPKQFGNEHPNSLIPVCNRCHNISHGVQEMKELTNVERMSDLSPNGVKIKYLICAGRVYASAKSWAHALQVPHVMNDWFMSGLTRTAILKKDSAGGELEMSYLNTPVYRWHAVSEQLRAFDRQWHNNKYNDRSRLEQEKIKSFHENYERLVSWGYDLQERAISSLINPVLSADQPVTQDTLLSAIKDAVAPRLREHDDKLQEHDVVISEIVNSSPVFRDQEDFISIKQAVNEQGLDSNSMPLYPRSKENLSGLAGQLLKKKGVEQGSSIVTRIDGTKYSEEMNTYRRKDIYQMLKEILEKQQLSLL